MPVKEKIRIIQEAIERQNRLRITYLKVNETKSQRVIIPLEVGEQIYSGRKFQGVRAFCHKAGEERMFRVDRILKLEVN